MASIVVADAGPLHYLILIGQARILERFFEHVLIPFAVRDELLHASASAAVKNWLVKPPAWLEVVPVVEPREIRGLHRGEAEAIQLALQRKTRTLLMDDLDGRTAAKRLGLMSIGTIGLLEMAAEKGFLHLATAFDSLRKTSFFASDELFKAALERERVRKEAGRK